MKKKIMVVDDSITVRQLITETLIGANYEIIEAPDGQRAMNQLHSNKVDAIITDLNMPQVDGLQLIQYVRKQPGNRFIPVILLTSETQTEKKNLGKEAGASCCLNKPFKPEQILSMIKMVCPQ